MRKCESPRVCSLVAPVSGEPLARDPRAAASGSLPASRRQVDFPSRLHFWPPHLRRDHGRGVARGRRRLENRRRLQGAGRRDRTPGPWPMADPRPGPRRAYCAARDARLWQRRNGLAPDDGRCRQPRNQGDIRWRRLTQEASDGPHSRSAAADGDRGHLAGRGRTLSDRAPGRARSGAHSLSHARRLGADQVSGAARRPQRSRHDVRRRNRKLRETLPRRCWLISAPRLP